MPTQYPPTGLRPVLASQDASPGWLPTITAYAAVPSPEAPLAVALSALHLPVPAGVATAPATVAVPARAKETSTPAGKLPAGERWEWAIRTVEPLPKDEGRLARALHLAATVPLAPADPPGLPALSELRLPGPRIEGWGRSGRVAVAVALRVMIRNPLLPALAELFRLRRQGQHPAVHLVLAQLARELGSMEFAENEFHDHWDTLITPEFAAVGIDVNAFVDGPLTRDAHIKWLDRHAVPRQAQLELVATRFAVRLHRAVDAADTGWFGHNADRPAEGTGSRLWKEMWDKVGQGVPAGDLLDPRRGQTIAVDGSIFKDPTGAEVHCTACAHLPNPPRRCDHPDEFKTKTGSRAKSVSTARARNKPFRNKDKRHGPTEGQTAVVVSSQGYRTHSTVILGLDLIVDGSGEINTAMPLLDHVLAEFAPGEISHLLYDGLPAPKHVRGLLRRHGASVVNHNSPRSTKAPAAGAGADTEAGPGDASEVRAGRGTAGITVRSSGHHKGKRIATRSYFLTPYRHTLPNGQVCEHPLISDDGAVYTTDRPGIPGESARGVRRGEVLTPVNACRHRRSDGTWDLEVTVAITCAGVEHPVTYPVTDLTHPDACRDGGYRDLMTQVRLIPAAAETLFERVYGWRNNAETVFSWLESRFAVKDRFNSYDLNRQRFELFAATLAKNADTWAHLAYRAQAE